MTRIFKLNPEAADPTGGITTDRLLLRTTGGARIDPAFARMGVSNTALVAALTDPISGVEYAPAGFAYVTRQVINGVPVADFSDTESTGASGGHSLPAALANTSAFTQVAIWKIDSFFQSYGQHIMHARAGDTENRAMLFQSPTGLVLARAIRSDGTLARADLISQNVGGYYAAAAVFDMANDTLTLYDLIGGGSVSVEIDGTSGASHSDVSVYRVGHATTLSQRFLGLLADALHLPYAAGAADITALQLHARARVNKLAAA